MSFFFYGPIEELGEPYSSMNFIATFSPLDRIMSLDDCSHNDLDELALHHELFHVTQDTKDRSKLNSQKEYGQYVEFYRVRKTGRPRIVINYEITSYGMELEMADILLDGYLCDCAKNGTKPDSTIIAHRLDARPGQGPMIRMLCDLWNDIFPRVFGTTATRVVLGSTLDRCMKKKDTTCMSQDRGRSVTERKLRRRICDDCPCLSCLANEKRPPIARAIGGFYI